MMEYGRIKRVMKERGFGFITSVDGKEVFFHRTECEGLDFETLQRGQGVRFELDMMPKGPRARRVTLQSESH